MNKISKSVQNLFTRRIEIMSKIVNLKQVENLGWQAFKATGDINAYGMIVSSRELQKEHQKEEEQTNGFGM